MFLLLLLLFFPLPVHLPLLEPICFLLFPGHRLPYSLHFVLTIVDSVVLEVLLVVVIACILAGPVTRRRHLLECAALTRRGLITFHPRHRSDIWAHVHLVDSWVLLDVQNLIAALKHRCLVAVRERPLIPLIVGDGLPYLLFQDLRP